MTLTHPELEPALRHPKIKNHIDMVGPVIVEDRLIVKITVAIDIALAIYENQYHQIPLPQNLWLQKSDSLDFQMGVNWNSGERILISLLENTEYLTDQQVKEYAEQLALDHDNMRKIWRHEQGIITIDGLPEAF